MTAKKEFDRAVEDFDHAIEIDPQRARTYTNRGIAWRAKSQYERAIDDFNRALHINPRDTWTQYNRLVAYLDAHRGDTATEARRILDQTGWNHELALHTAVIGHFAAKRNGQTNEAKRFLDEAAIRADSRQWTYQLIRFLRGEINEQALLSSAGDAAKMTEIHCFVGLHDTLSGRNEAALPHFRWVRDKGLPASPSTESRWPNSVESSGSRTRTIQTRRLQVRRPSGTSTEGRRSSSTQCLNDQQA